MNTEELYMQLKAAYSEENLHEISSGIISLYREKDEDAIRYIYGLVEENGPLKGQKISRVFSKLITSYHPDRFEQIQGRLRELRNDGDHAGLENYSHILDVIKIEFDNVSDTVSAAEHFEEEDIWDYATEGYSYIDEDGQESDDYDYMGETIMNHGFIAAVKRKIYGHLNVDFPVHLIEDLEVIEMADYEIENLDGIEYCTYARIIDLSGNNLTDITALGQLSGLEEVYLQNNQLDQADALGNLLELRVVDLSHNAIRDISPLFDCQFLEFVNIIGNRVPDWQIEQLSLEGIVVVA